MILPTDNEAMELRHTPLSLIDPSPFQTRKVFETTDLEESIKANGFKGAILVRPMGKRFQIVYGERRYRSMKNLRQKSIPSLVMELDDAAAAQMLLIENLQRADLDPFEEAEGIAKLKDAHHLSLKDLSVRLGKPKATLGQIVARAAAPKLARDAYYKTRDQGEYQFKLTHLDLIMRQPEPKDREELVKWCLQFRASTRVLENQLETNYRLPLSKALFGVTDDTLKRAACVDCPMRITNRREKGKQDASGDTCLSPGCYHFKNEQQIVKLAVARNCVALPADEAHRVLRYDGTCISSSYTNDWVALDDRCDDDPQRRTYKALLKGHDVARFLLVHRANGRMIEAAKSKDVYKILERAHQIKKGSARDDHRSKPSAADLAKRDEKKAKKLTWMDVAGEVALKAKALKPIPVEHWPHLWERFRYYDWHNAIGVALSRREIALPESNGSKSDYTDRVKGYAALLSPREQASFYYEVVWLNQAKHWWEYNNDSYSHEAAALVAQLDINPDDYYSRHLFDIRERKRVRAEQKARREKGGSHAKGKQLSARAATKR